MNSIRFRPRMGLCFCHCSIYPILTTRLICVSVPAWGFVFVIVTFYLPNIDDAFEFPSPHGALFLSFLACFTSLSILPVRFRPRMGLCFCHCGLDN